MFMENYVIIIKIKFTIKTYYVSKIKFSERFQLQELVNELNENNTLKREKKKLK